MSEDRESILLARAQVAVLTSLGESVSAELRRLADCPLPVPDAEEPDEGGADGEPRATHAADQIFETLVDRLDQAHAAQAVAMSKLTSVIENMAERLEQTPQRPMPLATVVEFKPRVAAMHSGQLREYWANWARRSDVSDVVANVDPSAVAAVASLLHERLDLISGQAHHAPLFYGREVDIARTYYGHSAGVPAGVEQPPGTAVVLFVPQGT